MQPFGFVPILFSAVSSAVPSPLADNFFHLWFRFHGTMKTRGKKPLLWSHCSFLFQIYVHIFISLSSREPFLCVLFFSSLPPAEFLVIFFFCYLCQPGMLSICAPLHTEKRPEGYSQRLPFSSSLRGGGGTVKKGPSPFFLELTSFAPGFTRVTEEEEEEEAQQQRKLDYWHWWPLRDARDERKKTDNLRNLLKNES